jgi:hypothetical protein
MSNFFVAKLIEQLLMYFREKNISIKFISSLLSIDELGTIDLLNDSSSFGNSFSNLIHLMNSIFYISQMNSFGSFGEIYFI